MGTVAKRLGVALISILGVAVLTFFITQLLPGDPAKVAAGQYATEEQVQQVRAAVRSRPDRRRTSSVGYIADFATFDLGTSDPHQPAGPGRADRAPAGDPGARAHGPLIAVILGVGLGVTAAVYRYRLGDRFVQLLRRALLGDRRLLDRADRDLCSWSTSGASSTARPVGCPAASTLLLT